MQKIILNKKDLIHVNNLYYPELNVLTVETFFYKTAFVFMVKNNLAKTPKTTNHAFNIRLKLIIFKIPDRIKPSICNRHTRL